MKERYLLGGSTVLLRALVEVVTADDDLDLIAIGGTADHPSHLVVEVPAEWADALRLAFRGQLIVEPDALIDPS
ncbi:hypothetical protein AB0F81_31045 [Actinoplanes sp. NPDC024001]|uniref:hypothetical protein n=1 Tax=Actinoplanes sp. NPDC024001 TaxID=3154598 RepID=UPI00340D84CF